MKKRVIFFISCLGILPFCFSQDIDSILINSETNFSDSIAKYNQQQKLLKLSHDAYNKGIQFFELNNFPDAINSFNEAIGMWIYSLILNKEDYLFFRLVFSRKAEITIRFAEIKKQ